MMAATRICGTTGLKALTSEARLTSDVLMLGGGFVRLLVGNAQGLAWSERRRAEVVRHQDRLNMGSWIASESAGGDAPDGVAGPDHHRVRRPRTATVGEPAGRDEERRGQQHDTAPSAPPTGSGIDRKSTRLNSSHRCSSYAVFCLKK